MSSHVLHRSWFALPLCLALATGSAAVAHAETFLPPLPARVAARSALAPRPTPTTGTPATIATVGEWEPRDPMMVVDPALILDAGANRLIATGGSVNGSTALDLASGAWVPLAAAPYGTYIGFRWARCVDPGTKVVYFPGYAAPGVTIIQRFDPVSGVLDTIHAAGSPPHVIQPALAFDGVHHRIVIMGGMLDVNYTVPAGQIWALDLEPTPTWTQWSVAGDAADLSLVGADLVVDPARDRLLVMNASDLYYGPVSGVGAVDLGGSHLWTRVSTATSPPDIAANGIALDPAGDRVVTIDAACTVHAFGMASSSWSVVPTSGAAPAARNWAGSGFDVASRRLFLSGGEPASGDDVFNDTWSLSLDGPPTWTVLVPNGVRAPMRGGAADALDEARHRIVIFSGANASGYPDAGAWTLTLDPYPVWAPLPTAGTPPPPRFWAATAFDGAHDRMVVFGGYGNPFDPNSLFGDTWVLSFASNPPAWTPVSFPGATPSARCRSAMAYDSQRDRFLLFNGFDFGATQATSDVWELTLGATPAWRLLHPTGATPTARSGVMALYDPIADRFVLMGGMGAADHPGDTWEFNPTIGDGRWTKWTFASGPSQRVDGVLRLDTQRHRALLFGGYGIDTVMVGATYIDYLHDTWELPLGAGRHWSRIAASGPQPAGRDRADGAYDAVNDRFVITDGGSGGANDTWMLAFGNAPTPTLLALEASDVTPERAHLVWSGASPGAMATAYRREGDGVWDALATLGADGDGRITLDDRAVVPGATYAYRLGVVSADGEQFTSAVSLRVPAVTLAVSPLASRRGVAFAIQLASDAPATLALYDLAGRRVWTRDLAGLGAGAHTVSDPGAPLASAIYFARLVQAGQVRQARVVVLR